MLPSMKKNFRLIGVLAITTFLTASFLPNSNAANISPKVLAKKISKAGLGCKKITEKTTMLFSGTKWICQVSDETVSIEVYPAKNWKKVKKLACSFDLGFIAVTDNKSWIVSAQSRETASKLVKPLGGKLTVFCNSNNIINETKTNIDLSGGTPTPSASPSVAVLGSWTKPFSWDATIKDEGFVYRLTSFQANATKVLCDLKAKRAEANPDDYDLILGGDLCPQSMDQYSSSAAMVFEYAVLNLEYTNETQQISSPGLFSIYFKIADANGKIYETVLLSYQDSKSLSIDAVPGATVPTSVYFKLPRDFVAQGSKIEVSSWNGRYYWSLK
jgi:hypothetical protein